MRTRAVVTSAALVAVFSCTQVEQPDTCADDEQLCKSFSKASTRVSCSCTCDVRVSIESKRSFSGAFDTCLPPNLNGKTASEAERAELAAMSPKHYDQEVFRFCNDRVASFLEVVVARQLEQTSKTPCLSRPVLCACAPTDAWTKSALCEKPCEEVQCGRDTCAPVAREGGTLELKSCWCSRVTTCGKTVPAAGEPAICRAEVRVD